VSTNLSHFRLIIPCGITDKGVTSIDALAARPVTMGSVESAITAAFAEVFEASMLDVDQPLPLAEFR